MHYGGNDGTTADDDFDSQLPCHNPNHNTIAHVYSPMVKVILLLNFPLGKPMNIIAGYKLALPLNMSY